MTILIATNIALIILVIILLVVRPSKKSSGQNALEDLELIEFQQNMHNLIDELNKVSESKLREMDLKMTEMNAVIKAVEAKIRELKYIIERNKYMREADLKTEIASPVPAAEFRPGAAQGIQGKNTVQPAVLGVVPAGPAKFTINENDETPPEAASSGETRNDYVARLIDSGMALDEISKITGINRGEIELIRNIKKR